MAKETKETKKMTETQTARENLLKTQKLQAPFTVIFIDGSEEKKKVEYEKIMVGVEPAGEDTLSALAAMLGGIKEQCEAFAYAITQRNYRKVKEQVYAVDGVLSPELVNEVCDLIAQTPTFSEESKTDIRKRWLQGFKEKRPGALVFLERAKVSLAAKQEASELTADF